jgi:hypothetical protein
MMEYKEYYLLPISDQWVLKTPGHSKPLKDFTSLPKAKAFALRLRENQSAQVRVQLQTGEWKELEDV